MHGVDDPDGPDFEVVLGANPNLARYVRVARVLRNGRDGRTESRGLSHTTVLALSTLIIACPAGST